MTAGTKTVLTDALNRFINQGIAAGVDVEGFDVRWCEEFEDVVYFAPCAGGGIESYDIELLLNVLREGK